MCWYKLYQYKYKFFYLQYLEKCSFLKIREILEYFFFPRCLISEDFFLVFFFFNSLILAKRNYIRNLDDFSWTFAKRFHTKLNSFTLGFFICAFPVFLFWGCFLPKNLLTSPWIPTEFNMLISLGSLFHWFTQSSQH